MGAWQDESSCRLEVVVKMRRVSMGGRRARRCEVRSAMEHVEGSWTTSVDGPRPANVVRRTLTVCAIAELWKYNCGRGVVE